MSTSARDLLKTTFLFIKKEFATYLAKTTKLSSSLNQRDYNMSPFNPKDKTVPILLYDHKASKVAAKVTGDLGDGWLSNRLYHVINLDRTKNKHDYVIPDSKDSDGNIEYGPSGMTTVDDPEVERKIQDGTIKMLVVTNVQQQNKDPFSS